MKKLKTTLPIESLIKSAKSQALIEGELQKKSSQPEINQILLVYGRNLITAIDIMDEQVFLEGKTFFNVVYTDMIGELYSFESSANFKHTIEVPGAKSGYKGFAICTTKEINHRLLPSGCVAVKAYADISCNIWTQINTDILTEVVSDANTYVREESITMPVQTAFKNTLISLRDDIRIPQNLPQVNKILDVSGYAIVKNITVESMKIVAEGDVRISIIYESKDKNAPIQHITSTMPFGEIIGIDEIDEKDISSIFTEIVDLSANSYDGNEDMISIDASIKLITSAYSFKKINVIGDIYSIKTKVECNKEMLFMRGLRSYTATKSIIRASVDIPKSAPDVSRVLFCRTNTNITKATAMQGYVEIEGLLYTQMCYACANGKITTASIETPFKTEVSIENVFPGMEVSAKANVEYFDVEGSGRDLDAKFSLEIALACYTNENKSVVLDATESQERVQREKGILVYIPQAGESAWDICKKFHITPSSLEALNKHTNIASIASGSKLIIFS